MQTHSIAFVLEKKSDFASALRAARLARGLSQESFDQVSSRTYISLLERSVNTPTLAKIESIAEVLTIHPLSLLLMSFIDVRNPLHALVDVDALLKVAASEVEALLRGG